MAKQFKKQKRKEAADFDIFAEASESVIARRTYTEEIILPDTITDNNLTVTYDKNARKTFEELKEAVDNEFASKFYLILHALPDREYVRVYLKLLEYFKPKITRKTGGLTDKRDTKLSMIIKRNEKPIKDVETKKE